MSSSPLAAKSNLATRSTSLNIPHHSTRTNHVHDLRYSLSAGPRTNEDRPPSGNGVAGILYKWINYGKGWKRRWFVLQDGVLSYYRIHGPDKISLSVEMDRRSKLIGGESLRFICRHSKRGDVHSPGKPLGQIHLKVSSIGQSISDAKRFTLYTGTKSLHLRAATSEDRNAWIEALKAVKETFPRMSNEELMASTTNVSLSTDKLRQRLMKEEVNETIIKDCEDIMKNNFVALHNEVMSLKQYQYHLVDSLRNFNNSPKTY
ncbi:PREDICTED: oxysterol-binding protein-related protein 1C-like [Camelina sativa]|uniref:Oxysterol-binding protein-related protein 1C-like n=1 Tax=Camelina sativa TaxID=90675 RepID=A0ABM0T137_CAMSA|nr:PREDICTED: oxysterol-binding protein-related protein 1C-like [Camelina sativa]